MAGTEWGDDKGWQGGFTVRKCFSWNWEGKGEGTNANNWRCWCLSLVCGFCFYLGVIICLVGGNVGWMTVNTSAQTSMYVYIFHVREDSLSFFYFQQSLLFDRSTLPWPTFPTFKSPFSFFLNYLPHIF